MIYFNEMCVHRDGRCSYMKNNLLVNILSESFPQIKQFVEMITTGTSFCHCSFAFETGWGMRSTKLTL